ncbi:hypothetical protein J6590_019768 [Homalodisca vitripennis]|nr:hypothetical protein J6590_019768 [Homalodisca vitripennis]
MSWQNRPGQPGGLHVQTSWRSRRITWAGARSTPLRSCGGVCVRGGYLALQPQSLIANTVDKDIHVKVSIS